MNNKVKTALAVIAGGTLILAMVKRRKREKLKTFVAPDGNTYKENQIYRTFDDQIYKNGKKIHFNTLDTEQVNDSSSPYFEKRNENFSTKNQNVNKEVSYHNRGNRHQ